MDPAGRISESISAGPQWRWWRNLNDMGPGRNAMRHRGVHHVQGGQLGNDNQQNNFWQLVHISIGGSPRPPVRPSVPGRYRRYLWLIVPVAVAGAILFLPWRWRPEWRASMPELLFDAVRGTVLLISLYALLLGRRAITAGLLALLLAGALIAPPGLVDPGARCGSATILTQASLMGPFDAELGKMIRKDAFDCVRALRLVRADSNVSALLRASGAAAGGLITSDPEVIGNLDPHPARPPSTRWSGVEVAAEPTATWFVLGSDVASVYLPSQDHTRSAGSLPFERSIAVGDVPVLSFQADAPGEAVAIKVGAVAGRDRMTSSAYGFGAGEQTCPTGVVIPASWTDPPCHTDDQIRATIVDDAYGGPIGVPILGIPLQASPTHIGPVPAARRAVTEFFARLRAVPPDPVRIGPPGDLRSVVADSESRPPLVVRKPLHLIAVVDASLSTGRNTDTRNRGGPAPLAAALAGLARTGGGTDTGDRASILIAQDVPGSAGRRPIEWTVSAATPVPAVTARGETGLPVFLSRAWSLRADAVRRGDRTVSVLLTDGLNVFTEHRTRAADLRDATVLVIGNSNGCAAVPASLRKRCRSALGTPDDVAAQLNRLLRDR
jgi:hypothetical protein